MTYTLRDPDGCALPLDDVLAEDADLDCVGDVPGRYARVAASVGRSRGAGVVRSWIIEDGEGEVLLSRHDEARTALCGQQTTAL